jgi:hypothetical protein
MNEALIAFVDGVERARIAAPVDFAGRAWLLGVVAVQATVEGGRVAARLRAHLTGAGAPTIVPLAPRACVHVALAAGAAPPLLAPIEPPALAGAAARLALFLDGARVAEAALERARMLDRPAPRAFGHVYCRWLRDGAPEPGWDLTAFLSLRGGTKYPRLAAGPLGPGQVAGYAFCS